MRIFIQIENKGEVEHQAFNLLGASTKRQDNSKIGFFGSGNKYAIALMLRKNIFFKVYSGKKEIKFDKKPVTFRDGTYEMITINGKDTSMTTDMGPTWEDWFIIREFYCNAVDEGGAKLSVTDKITPKEGVTRIFIEKTDELAKFFQQIERYILVGKRDVLATEETQFGNVSILPAFENEFIAYRKGIRCHVETNKKSLYRYNFDKVGINESRVVEYEYNVRERIAGFFARTLNQDYILNYLKNWKGTYEEGACWNYVFHTLSPAWYEVLKGHRVYPEKYAMHSGDYEGKMNSFIVPNYLAHKIHESFKDINVIGYSKDEKYKVVDMTFEQAQVVNTARKALADIGYPLTCNIVLAEFYEGDVVGMWDREKNQVVLAKDHFTDNQGTLQNTLLEEYFHSKGQVDGQRTFVTFLINELLQAKKVQYGKTSNTHREEN